LQREDGMPSMRVMMLMAGVLAATTGFAGNAGLADDSPARRRPQGTGRDAAQVTNAICYDWRKA
jgi:hypothetical protein